MTPKEWNPVTGHGDDVEWHRCELESPYRWQEPCTVRVCPDGDLFEPNVPAAFIKAVLWTMMHAAHHTFHVSTAHPERATRLMKCMIDIASDDTTTNAYIRTSWSYRWMGTPTTHRWCGDG